MLKIIVSQMSRMILLVCLLAVPLTLAEGPRAVIIGFDGADAELIQDWMDQGELPNLAALRDEGTFAPLQPTNPPQTPVSWSTFATGLDPGQTEIFDFLKRNPDDYLPDFAMITESRRIFMFGENNGVTFGLLAAGALLLLTLILSWFLSITWRTRAVLSVLVAAVAGLSVGYTVEAFFPVEIPDAINNRQGQTMWELASQAGKTVQVIRVPATFPAEPVGNGTMLSGLGVPDMRGRVGTPSYYTSDPAFDPENNDFSLELVRLSARRGVVSTEVMGPRNKPFFDYVVDREAAKVAQTERRAMKRRVREELRDAGVESRIDLPLVLEATDTTVTITLSGKTVTLQVGEWSDWFDLQFPVNAVLDKLSPLVGIARFKLLATSPHLELYMSPINFHPDCHPVAFAYPPEFSEQLLDDYGMYKTLGWALDTWSLPSGVGDEDLFLEDMYFTVARYEEMMEGMLTKSEADLFIQIFYFPDRIGHLFWRFLDTGHALYDAQLAAKYGDEILKAYKKMDQLVGKARALVDPDTLFLVLSDHGFSSFRRGVNYNNWLEENGLLVLKNQPSGRANLEQLFDTRDLFADVDWSQTKAYALGLGAIYINRLGRERYGTVLPGKEYDDVRQQIKAGLESLVDPLTGEHPVSRVWYREDMYADYDDSLVPDLRVANNHQYRVSWQTSLGGFGDGVIEDNTRAWSGDHCSLDPDQVHGVLFLNRKINTDAPRMRDVMPTVLEHLGIPTPADVQGVSLF
jgi:predicted AlkP superfamily phosphohydrolase/phosphomutase